MEEILASIRRIIADDQEAGSAPESDEAVSSPVKNVLELTERHVAAERHASPERPGSADRHGSSPFTAAPSLQEDDDDGFSLHADTFQGDDAISAIVSRYGREPSAPQPAPLRPTVAARSVPTPVHAPAPAPGPAPADPLLSNQAKASVSDSFGRLGAALMPTEPRTVEDLMRDILRPMLKEWLDENLPSLVERLVQAEIERVTRGRA